MISKTYQPTLECIPNDPLNSISDDGLVMNRQLAITLTNADTLHIEKYLYLVEKAPEICSQWSNPEYLFTDWVTDLASNWW